MDRTSNPRRVAVTLSLIAGSALALFAAPAQAQDSRWRVLVPYFFNTADNDKNFGKKVAEELRDLLDDLEKYRSVTKDELKSSLERFGLKNEEVLMEANCVTARQLASQVGYELYVCGNYVDHEEGKGATVNVSIIPPKEGDSHGFTISTFDADDPEMAAQRIISEFQLYTELISQSAYCADEINSQNWQAAIDHCDQALAVNPDHEPSVYMRSQALWKLGRLDEAYQGFMRVLELDPGDLNTIRSVGLLLIEMDRKEEAHEYFNEYLTLNPSDSQVRLYLAIEAATAGDPIVALNMIEEGLAANAIDDIVLAAEYASQIAFQAAAEVAPAMTDPVPPAAVPYLEKAILHSETVMDAKGAETSADVLINTLNAYRLLGRTDDAVAFGERAVSAAPSNARLLIAHAEAVQKAGDVDRAVELLEQARQADPSAQVNGRLAVWELQRGNIDAAWTAIQAVAANQEMDETRTDNLIRNFAVKSFEIRAQDRELAIRRFNMAGEIATAESTHGMLDYFHGVTIFEPVQVVMSAENVSVAAARDSKVKLAEVLRYMEGARRFTADQPGSENTRNQIIANSNALTEIADLIIQRGGG